MDFMVDNAVPLSAIALGVLVIVALAVLAVRALRLWRVLKATERHISGATAGLLAETDRLSAALAALPDRQAELQGSIASLSARVRVLSVLARSASEASAVLRSPLRYLGR
jgi:hypothetical protein